MNLNDHYFKASACSKVKLPSETKALKSDVSAFSDTAAPEVRCDFGGCWAKAFSACRFRLLSWFNAARGVALSTSKAAIDSASFTNAVLLLASAVGATGTAGRGAAGNDVALRRAGTVGRVGALNVGRVGALGF